MIEFLCVIFAGLALLVMAQWLRDRIDAGALENAAARETIINGELNNLRLQSEIWALKEARYEGQLLEARGGDHGSLAKELADAREHADLLIIERDRAYKTCDFLSAENHGYQINCQKFLGERDDARAELKIANANFDTLSKNNLDKISELMLARRTIAELREELRRETVTYTRVNGDACYNASQGDKPRVCGACDLCVERQRAMAAMPKITHGKPILEGIGDLRWIMNAGVKIGGIRNDSTEIGFIQIAPGLIPAGAPAGIKPGDSFMLADGTNATMKNSSTAEINTNLGIIERAALKACPGHSGENGIHAMTRDELRTNMICRSAGFTAPSVVSAIDQLLALGLVEEHQFSRRLYRTKAGDEAIARGV